MIGMATALLKRMFISDMIDMATRMLLKRILQKRHDSDGNGVVEMHVSKATWSA